MGLFSLEKTLESTDSKCKHIKQEFRDSLLFIMNYLFTLITRISNVYNIWE